MIWIAVIFIVIAGLLLAEGIRMILRDDQDVSREFKQ